MGLVLRKIMSPSWKPRNGYSKIKNTAQQRAAFLYMAIDRTNDFAPDEQRKNKMHSETHQTMAEVRGTSWLSVKETNNDDNLQCLISGSCSAQCAKSWIRDCYQWQRRREPDNISKKKFWQRRTRSQRERKSIYMVQKAYKNTLLITAIVQKEVLSSVKFKEGCKSAWRVQ